MGLFESVAWSALAIALPMAVSAWLLMRAGIDTRGRRLEDIQHDLHARAEGANR